MTKLIKKIIRRLKMAFDVLTKGWCEVELWDLSSSITDNLVPRLKEFAKMTSGRPFYFKTQREWERCINRMAWAFEHRESAETTKERSKVSQGMLDFVTYFNYLWD